MSKEANSISFKIIFSLLFVAFIAWQLISSSQGAAKMSAPSDMDVWQKAISSVLVFSWLVILMLTPTSTLIFSCLFFGFAGLFISFALEFLALYVEPVGWIFAYQGLINLAALFMATIGILFWSFERSEEHKNSKNQISVDSLTGLYNTRFFYQELENEIRRVRRYQRDLALLLVRVEGLRQYNDMYGYSEGDKVLKDMGQSILGYLRRSDLGSRFGASEFAVLLPETPTAGAALVAQRLQNRLHALNFVIDGQTIKQKISVAVVQLQNEETSMGLVRRAENLLDEALEQGGNMIIKK